MDNLHLVLREQFPQFARTNYPAFIEFIEAYYKWLDFQSIGKLEDVVDIDQTASQFVKYFRDQLDIGGLFSNADLFDTRYIKNIKEIYAAKGSEQALIYLLHVVHGASTEIVYPSKQILKSSDGKWVRESFVTVNKLYGTLPVSITSFYVVYPFSVQTVPITRYEVIDNDTIRLYYKFDNTITPSVSDVIQLREGSFVAWTGILTRSPSRVSVLSGGQNWQLGQVIEIPGTSKNTIVRVSSIDAMGAITTVEVLDHGYEHTEYQSLIVSPYAVKPAGAIPSLTTNQISQSPAAYQYVLSIDDYTDGATESITGTIGSNTVMQFTSAFAETPISTDSAVTLEQWFASRATVSLNFDTIVNTKGRWTDDAGQLSNQNIRLQDNLYYQQFSYVIDSTASPDTYVELAASTAPAGIKLFTNYSLVQELSFIFSGNTSFPYVTIEPLDIVTVLEQKGMVLTRPFADSLDPATDEIALRELTRPIAEDAEATDESGRHVTRPVTGDEISALDAIETMLAGLRTLFEEATITDQIIATEFIKTLDDIIEALETVSKSYDKYFDDSATISSPETASTADATYDSESYFAEDYAAIETILTLGA